MENRGVKMNPLDTPPRKSIRLILVICGCMAVILGVIGIFLPIMPTTVFLLIAAACFIRSSPKLHTWLLNHRILGTYIKAAQGKSGIPLKGKIITLSVLWITILYSTFWVASAGWLKAVLLIIATAVTVFIVTRKTLPANIKNNTDPLEKPEDHE